MRKTSQKIPSIDTFLKQLVEDINKPQGTIASIGSFSLTASGVYTQSEIQQLSNKISELTNKVNEMIALLKSSNISS